MFDSCPFPCFFKNILNFWVSSVRVSVSQQLLEHSSSLSSFWTVDLSVIPFCFLSPCSCLFSLFISNSCSLSFPNNAAVVKVVRSLVFEMVLTFGCQLLSKHFRIFMFSSSLSNAFPKRIRWFTMWVNRFWTSAIVSPGFIPNNSYSYINACFLALLTSLVPSCVTSKVPHISFVEAHCDTLKIHQDKETVIIFFAIKSY